MALVDNSAELDVNLLRATALKCHDDFIFFARTCLKIGDKGGNLSPLILNSSQIRLHEHLENQLKTKGKVRVICLKGRQMGISTLVEARYYWKLWRTKVGKTLRAFILTHTGEATENLFNMAKRYHDNMPRHLQPPLSKSNIKELVFADTGCNYAVATAGGVEIGRGLTLHFCHLCLSPETWVMTPSFAPKRMKDFAVGEKVRTHTGAIAPISYISKQEKECFALQIMGANEPIVATAQHKLLTKEGFKEVQFITEYDCVGLPISKISNNNVKWAYRIVAENRNQYGGTQEVGPDEVEPSYEVGRILGLYLAEGSVAKQYKTGKPYRVTFTVHEREVERTLQWLETIRHWFRNEPKARANKKSKTVHIEVNGGSFANFILNICGEKDNKHFPSQWPICGEDFARGLLHGYLAGDGSSSKQDNSRMIAIPSIRGALTFGLRNLLASMGYGVASIRYREGAIRNGRNEKAQWTLNLCGSGVDKLCEELNWYMPSRKRENWKKTILHTEEGYMWFPIKSISSVGKQEVMDFEVAHKDHSYLLWQGSSSNSEVAFWPNAEMHVASLLNTALSKADGTESIIESTANGIGNVYHRYWQDASKGKSEYEAVFLPWYKHEEYEMEVPDDWEPPEEFLEYGQLYELTWEKLYWIYITNREFATAAGLPHDKFTTKTKQEYPANADEAFQVTGESFIPAISVLRARKVEKPLIGTGPVILGVDPARTGDLVGIIDRCGRRMGQRIAERWEPGGNLVHLSERIAHVLDKIRPDAVCIDVGGNGAGVYDNLLEWGYANIIHAVNFGSKPIGRGPTGDEMYFNRRAEMYDNLRAWFETEGGVQIPDDDALQTDLTAIKVGPGATRYNNNNELIIEDKEKIKSRLGSSPDLGDAAALTFAVTFYHRAEANWQPPPPRRKTNRRTGY